MKSILALYYRCSVLGLLFILFPLMVCGQVLDKKSLKELRSVSKEYEKKDYPSANKIIINLLKKYPDNPQVLHWKAKLNCGMGNFALAKKSYQDALENFESELDDLDFETSRQAQRQKETIRQEISRIRKEKGLCEKQSSNQKETEKTNHSKNSQKKVQNGAKPVPNSNGNSHLTNNKTGGGQVKTIHSISKPETQTFQPVHFVETHNSKWHSFISHGRENQLKELKKFISKFYQLNKDSLNQSYETIIKTSHSWIKKNAFKQYEWFDNLEKKEQEFREATDRYDSCVRTKIKIDNEIKIAKNDSIGIINKLKIASEDSASFADIYNTVLKDELMTKLSTIPQSIVLVGRIAESNNESKAQRLMDLMTVMTDIAIKSVNGYTIITQRFSGDSGLSSLYSLSSEGIAETVDKYYKSLVINPNVNNNKLFFYEIYRIEVFPFNKNIKDFKTKTEKLKTLSDTSLLKKDIDVYVPDIVGGSIKSLDEKIIEDNRVLDGKATSLKDHRLDGEKYTDVRDFIKMISKTSDDFNKEYDKRIAAAINDYKLKRKQYFGKILAVQNMMKEIINEKRRIRDRLDSLRVQEQNLIRLRTGSVRDNYIKSKHAYQDFYMMKNQLVNQLAVISIENVDNGIEGGFEGLVKECYNSVVSNLQKRYNKTTVFHEIYQNQGEDIIGLEKSEVNYRPELDSFKVLSMIKYNKNEETYLSLNMAFNVKWKIDDKDSLYLAKSEEGGQSFGNIESGQPASHKAVPNTFSVPDNFSNKTTSNVQNTNTGISSATDTISGKIDEQANQHVGFIVAQDTMKADAKMSISGANSSLDSVLLWKIVKVNATFSDYLYGKKNESEKLPTLKQLKEIIEEPDFKIKIRQAVGNNIRYVVIPTIETHYDENDFKVYRSLRLDLSNFETQSEDSQEGDLVTVVVQKGYKTK